MKNLIETMGVGGLQFEVWKIAAFYAISAVIKTVFVIINFSFAFLSIVRACDNKASAAKRSMFLGYSFLSIYALGIFFGWGYNPLLVIGFEAITLTYWAKEEVAIKSILMQEWEEDWLPRIHNVVVLFKTLTRH